MEENYAQKCKVINDKIARIYTSNSHFSKAPETSNNDMEYMKRNDIWPSKKREFSSERRNIF